MQTKLFSSGGASKQGWPDTTVGTVTGAANDGAGRQVFSALIGAILHFRTLVPGTNITLTQNANDVTFDCPAPGEINTASNLGAGGQVFKSKVASDLQFRSIVAGANITVTQNANDLTIAASGGGGGLPEFQFFADQLNTPNNADWTINAFATVIADSLNNALSVRQFDDTLVEGIGFTIEIPSGASNIIISPRARAQTAPGVAKQVILKLYSRDIPDNAAVAAWSAGTALTAIDIPTNTNYQYDTQTLTLAGLGLTAGRLTQFELVRVGSDGSDTLVGDWNLEELKISFT